MLVPAQQLRLLEERRQRLLRHSRATTATTTASSEATCAMPSTLATSRPHSWPSAPP